MPIARGESGGGGGGGGYLGITSNPPLKLTMFMEGFSEYLLNKIL